MFPKRQRIKFVPHFSIVLPRLQTNENEETIVSYEDESKGKLPDVSSTRLRDLLDAGVDLKQVNTKLFKPTEVVTDLTTAGENNDAE